jgi:phage tail sheath protein FI
VPTYETPGVYYERVDATAPAIAALRTDIAGFVGIARRGPLHTPVPIQSWRQYQAYFGDFTGAGYLAYAVRAFFENGGQRCWIVRVASDAAATALRTLGSLGVPHGPVWQVDAFSPGVWGNDLDVALRETHRAQTRSDPVRSTPEASRVASISGFARATHVRLLQWNGATKIEQTKVVSDVDAEGSRLIWVHPEPEARLPYDGPLSGFDPNQSILIESIEYTLLVRELERLIATYEGLSLIPEHLRYGPRVLAALALGTDGGAARILPAVPAPIVIEELRVRPLPSITVDQLDASDESFVALTGGADGLAALTTEDFIGAPLSPYDSDVARAQKLRGLRPLEDIAEIAIVAVPDINIQPVPPPRKAPLPPCIPNPCLPDGPPAIAPHREPAVGDLPPTFGEDEIFEVQEALVLQCEAQRDRIALIDPPYKAARDDRLGVAAARAWRQRFDSKYAAFYYPWLKVEDPLRGMNALTRDIPPSGHVAGFYAQSDFAVGVHKAPANGPLAWVQDVTAPVDETVHGILNPEGINAIRVLPSRGIRIFGARTVSADPDWRFVNVRRLLMMIEKAIDVSIQWAVFEPNDTSTRAKLNLVLTSFLVALWQRGALMGKAAAEAFFVKCDEDNNPASERANGRLLAEIGVAPSKPFEFVVLRVGRSRDAFEISETAYMTPAGGMD